MRIETILKKATLSAGSLVLGLSLAACAHHSGINTNVDSSGIASGENRPAVSSTQNVPGPTVVDSSGNAYVSSAAPGAGNASSVGTNTNVNVVPKRSSSTVTVTEIPSVAESTPAPAPAPYVAPAPSTPSMSSSTDETTTETTTTRSTSRRHHRKE